DHLGDGKCLSLWRANADDTIHVHALFRHFFNCEDIGIAIEFVRRVDHLCKATAVILNQYVGQQQSEWLMADQLACTPDSVAKAKWRLLAGEAHGSSLRQVFRQEIELGLLASFRQGQLEFELTVEVILNHALVAPGNKDEMLDTGLARLI